MNIKSISSRTRVVLLVAAGLLVASTATAGAAQLITGQSVKNESLTGRDVRNGTLKGAGFPAEQVTSLVADWDDAPTAYAARTTKLVLHRPPLALDQG
jgi:hypothetical protein